MSTTYEHLVTTLTDKFEVSPASIRPDASFNDLALDSLAVVELFVTLQEHWGVPIDEGDAAGELTLEKTIELIDAAKGAE